MRIAYFDCIAGISGDMALGALLDAGADFDEIRRQLSSLPVEPFDFELEEVETFGIRATQVTVRARASGIIRTYASIRALLDAADLTPDVRHTAQRVFRRLAEAEAKVHHKEVDLVTFHEIGAVDSIVDITGTAVALSVLGIERVFASPVPTGLGMMRTEHGAMPIPGPAVVELLRGAPMYSRGVPVELVTPTGAAILSALAEGYGDLPLMRVESVGYGVGSHRLDFPNILRVMVGTEEETHRHAPSPEQQSGDVMLETNIDDLNPELYEYVMERLFAAGAQDAWLTPIVMKKSRPAVTVSVLCSAERAEGIRSVLFRETGTLGIRAVMVSKEALDRELMKVETSHGPVAVKVGFLEGQAVTVAPEFEDCTRAAREAGVPARDVYEEALRLAREELDRS
ncbi:MAG: nickel pincer cofactor biosynthesis protein LarC [Actinomycetota bacterium]|nr:nickel pincer cofactor biosynthesis protein LarC [Actinomycetota bacterium]